MVKVYCSKMNFSFLETKCHFVNKLTAVLINLLLQLVINKFNCSSMGFPTQLAQSREEKTYRHLSAGQGSNFFMNRWHSQVLLKNTENQEKQEALTIMHWGKLSLNVCCYIATYYAAVQKMDPNQRLKHPHYLSLSRHINIFSFLRQTQIPSLIQKNLQSVWELFIFGHNEKVGTC